MTSKRLARLRGLHPSPALSSSPWQPNTPSRYKLYQVEPSSSPTHTFTVSDKQTPACALSLKNLPPTEPQPAARPQLTNITCLTSIILQWHWHTRTHTRKIEKKVTNTKKWNKIKREPFYNNKIIYYIINLYIHFRRLILNHTSLHSWEHTVFRLRWLSALSLHSFDHHSQRTPHSIL
jgi:hypothetical protein